MILGVGTDLVAIESFAQQLAEPATRFARVFTGRERRVCASRPNETASLAARWAVKEAFIKAWSAALTGTAPPLSPDLVDWAEIETTHDAWNRPSLLLHGEVARLVAASLGMPVAHVSISHDGPIAMAVVILERRED